MSKANIFRIHKWCGAVASLLILIQALTGIVEAYQQEVAQLIDPAAMIRQSQGNYAPLDDVLDTLRAAYPARSVNRIVFPVSPTATYFVHLNDEAGEKTYLSIDPGTASILRQGNIWTFPAEAAARIHYDYTIGLPGMLIVATTGLLGLLMATTGLIYWWPRRGRRLSQLSIKWQAQKKMVLRQLHRSTGVIMSLLIIYSLATGLTLAIYYAVADITATAQPVADLSEPPVFDIDDLVRRARTAYPGNDIRDIRFPHASRANIYLHAPKHSPRAAHMIAFDLRSERVTATLDADSNNELWVTWLPLHSGESFGIVGTLLVTANALVLSMLALSGPIMWFNRANLKRRKNR